MVTTYGRDDLRGKLELSVEGRPPCAFELPRDVVKVHEVCRLDLPAGTRELRLGGSVGRAKGAQRFRVVDLAPMLHTLRDGALPFGQRLARFAEARRKFEAAEPELADFAATTFELEGHATDAEVADAEKRIGFALPEEHRSFLREAGRMGIDDSYSMMPAELARAFDQMMADWGTPEEAMKELPEDWAGLFRSSTILYTEVGDGLGALLYQPPVEGQCAGEPAYWWWSQEGGDPELLRNGDGRCKGYVEAMVWLVANQSLQRYDDDPTQVIVDTSAPAAFPLLLRPGADEGGLACELSPLWGAYE